MPKAFTLPEKPCELGKKFTTKGEGEGGERKSVATFSLSLLFTGKELDKLAGAGTHARWYTKDAKSGEIVPAFDDVSEIKFAHRYTDSTATLDLDGTTLTLPKSKFMNIAAQRQNGGNTLVELDVETPADLVDGVTDIGNFGGRKIRAQLAFGEKAGADARQPELPMEHDEDDEDDEEPAKKRGNGRSQPGAH
jgi:hypothetical protein